MSESVRRVRRAEEPIRVGHALIVGPSTARLAREEDGGYDGFALSDAAAGALVSFVLVREPAYVYKNLKKESSTDG